MKKLTMCLLLAASVFVSCSDDDSDTSNNNNNDGWSGNPISGELYGNSFEMKGAKASFISFFDVQSVEIEISSQMLNCTAGSSDENFPIKIVAPREIGTFTNNVYVSYNDPNSTDYVSVSSGNTIEITALTPSFVRGRIRSASATTENAINGTFDVTVCPE